MSVENDILEGVQGLLIFCVGDKELCADMGKVTTIIRLGEANLKNKNKQGGLIMYEERSFRMIDISELLKVQMNEFTNDTRIVLCEACSKLFGFIADKIIEIITIDSSFQEKYLDWLPASVNSCISGDLLFQNRKITLLDVEKLGRELNSVKYLDFDLKQFDKSS